MTLTAGPLTVKHVEEGREGIVQAVRVDFTAGGLDSVPYVTAYGVPHGVSGSHETYQTGTVYVMNEAGATVGRYTLEDGAPQKLKAA